MVDFNKPDTAFSGGLGIDREGGRSCPIISVGNWAVPGIFDTDQSVKVTSGA